MLELTPRGEELELHLNLLGTAVAPVTRGARSARVCTPAHVPERRNL